MQTVAATQMLLGGQRVRGEGAAVKVLNPSTGEETTCFPGASLAQVKRAIADARTSFDSGTWATMAATDRVAVLRRFLWIVTARADDLKRLIVTETGVPVNSFALDAQVGSPLRQMEVMLNLYLRLPEIEENPLTLDERVGLMGGMVQSVRRYVPVGVVVAISAYNFPVHISLWKVLPALAAGNSVILRPSPLTPLSALWMVDAAIEAGIPAGVLSIIVEPGADGALLLTTDPAIDMVSFTGSSDVGRRVAVQAAATLKRVQLELGGKSAQIYLPDRIEAAFGAAISACLSHAGQACVLGSRIFVPEADKPKVLAAMKASVTHARIGDSTDPSTTMGPVISAAQVERCERFVRLAVEAGATIVAGGKRVARRGFYFEPTVLDCPDNRNPAAQEEIFGPVVCVIGYRDLDHAVSMANDSPYGLSGYVHGKDARTALGLAKRIRSGTVNVNAVVASAAASSGGHKQSGIGRERGIEGIRVYQEIQCLNLGTALER